MTSVTQPYPARPGDRDLMGAKEALRTAIRAEREKRSARTLARAADDFAQVVGDMAVVRRARCAAVYVSRTKEPGTVALIERLARRGTRVLLPVLGSGLQRDWAWFTCTEELQERAPGRPPEPAGPSLGAEALGEAEVVVVPALAVDTAGARLGQGGGWYDRVLVHARDDAPRVAMVFPEELYDAATRPLPQERHDRRIDLVATTAGWQRLGAQTPA